MTRILDHIDLRPLAWQDSALCSQVDPDLFDGGEKDAPAAYDTARSICRKCPVQVDCLTYALENNEQYGLWGGKSPRERRAILQGRRNGVPPNWVKAKAASEEAFANRARATIAAHARHRAEGRNNLDIAAALGISAKSYSRRVTRARRLLERLGELNAA